MRSKWWLGNCGERGDLARTLAARYCLSRGVLLASLIGIVACASNAGSGAGGSAGVGGLGGAAGSSAGGAGGAPRLSLVSPNHYLASGVSLPLGFGAAGTSGATGANAGGASAGGASGAAAGASGAANNALTCVPTVPPGTPPAIASCGDGFRTGAEQCDDGNLMIGDGCSPTCRVTPMLVAPHPAQPGRVLPPPSRELGLSRHPLASGCNQVGVTYVDRASAPPALNLATFLSVGKPLALLNFGTAKVDSPNPALAALPDDKFVVAWTDFDGDGDELGIQLRKLDPLKTTQAPSIFANAQTMFSQRAPDVVFDGTNIIVAWVDDSDEVAGPDLHYRTFSPDLVALSDSDQTLAATAAVEDHVALAAYPGRWAAAWRSGLSGSETIEIQSASTHWTVGPFAPGAADDRPALVFFDANHLAVAFTEGSDPSVSGTANTPRLYAAILDAAAPGLTPAFPVAPVTDPYATTPAISQTQPALTAFADRLLVGWRSDPVPGNAAGGELWTREVRLSQGAGNTVLVDTSSPELPLLASAQRVGDQVTPVLLSSPLWPEHRLVSAWQDMSRTVGTGSGSSDVALQFAPAPTTDASNVPFELSASGKYYLVNVLRRAPGFPLPIATATYSGMARQYILPPSATFDGDDNSWAFSAGPPAGAIPDASSTITIDLGRVLSLGAIRPVYVGTYRTPTSFQLRLAEQAGQWTTVIPTQLVDKTQLSPHALTSEFPATRARYLEFTMTGTPAFGYVDMMEFIVLPSAPQDPPPSTLDGYDLAYLSGVVATQNSNMIAYNSALRAPRTLFDQNLGDYVAGKTLEQGANGDGTITIDLGGWYPISQVVMMFYYGYNWRFGGSIEVASNQSSWNKVTDSGRGVPLGTPDGPQAFTFSKQTARYVRITAYFEPGVGVYGAPLTEVQIF